MEEARMEYFIILFKIFFFYAQGKIFFHVLWKREKKSGHPHVRVSKYRNVEIERILWGKIVVSVGWPLADMTRSEWNLHSAT